MILFKSKRISELEYKVSVLEFRLNNPPLYTSGQIVYLKWSAIGGIQYEKVKIISETEIKPEIVTVNVLNSFARIKELKRRYSCYCFARNRIYNSILEKEFVAKIPKGSKEYTT